MVFFFSSIYQDITRDCQMGIRPYAETLLQGCEQALLLGDLKASEKVVISILLACFKSFKDNSYGGNL